MSARRLPESDLPLSTRTSKSEDTIVEIYTTTIPEKYMEETVTLTSSEDGVMLTADGGGRATSTSSRWNGLLQFATSWLVITTTRNPPYPVQADPVLVHLLCYSKSGYWGP